MIIYPAIDLRGRKCVRLTQGCYHEMTVFSDDPVEIALRWQDAGAGWLHVVDLDAARGEGPANRGIIEEIVKRVSIPVQTGGGIRTMADIEDRIAMGISRVILGTSAVNRPDLVADAVLNFGNSIAVGIDARDGMVAIEGWEKTSPYTALEFAQRMENLGVKTIIYTDISTDGTLMGPNLNAMEEMQRTVSMDIIASGGVGSVEDLINLARLGMKGAIIGKALYTGAVDLGEAIRNVNDR